MIQILSKAMPEGFSLETNDLAAIVPLFHYRKLKNNEIFYTPGQKKSEIALILSGVVRHYLIDTREREKTTDFCRSGEFTGTLSDSPDDNSQYLASIGETELVVADAAQLMAIVQNSLTLQQFFSAVITRYFQLKTKREAELVGLEPAERYKRFVQTFPDLLDAVPQYLIASYLGIAPETLSRIRGR